MMSLVVFCGMPGIKVISLDYFLIWVLSATLIKLLLQDEIYGLVLHISASPHCSYMFVVLKVELSEPCILGGVNHPLCPALFFHAESLVLHLHFKKRR